MRECRNRFNVLMNELRSLCLEVKVRGVDSKPKL